MSLPGYRFGQERAEQFEVVCCDMWQPCVDVVRARSQGVIVVLDKFQIVQHVTQSVDQVLRDEIREKGEAHKDLIFKARDIWLKDPWRLTDKQFSRLSELETLRHKINRTYLLKGTFREFWAYTHVGWAKRYLDKWFWWATHSCLPAMRDFAQMPRRH